MDNNQTPLGHADLEKKFKRKIVELLTISNIIKELNLSLDLESSNIIEMFTNSVAGLFLINKSALILLGIKNIVYVINDDALFKKEVQDIGPQIEKIFSELKEKEDTLAVGQIIDEQVRNRLSGLDVELVVPMFLRKELRGIYLVGKKINSEPYAYEDMKLLFAFANQAMVTIENASFFKRMQRHVEELTIFNEVTAAINSELDISVLLDMVLGVLLKILKANAGFIMILRENKSILFFVHQELDEKQIEIVLNSKEQMGMVGKGLSSSSERLAFYYPEEAMQQEKEIFLDPNQNMHYWFYRSIFVRKENIIGIVGLRKKKNEDLSEEDINLFLTFTSQLIMIILNARLYELAITDGLTGLFVHSYFEQRLREEISRARRYSSSVSVIMMDVDHFKEYNDRLGHQAGNIILKKIASIISLSVRKNEDIPARWGGDEFAIILPETAKEGASILAERIRKNIETFSLSPQKEGVKPLTISAGIAAFPADAIEDTDLIAYADSALYQSKNAGGNKVVLYVPG